MTLIFSRFHIWYYRYTLNIRSSSFGLYSHLSSHLMHHHPSHIKPHTQLSQVLSLFVTVETVTGLQTAIPTQRSLKAWSTLISTFGSISSVKSSRSVILETVTGLHTAIPTQKSLNWSRTSRSTSGLMSRLKRSRLLSYFEIRKYSVRRGSSLNSPA